MNMNFIDKLTKEDILKYSKIVGLILIIMISSGISIGIILNSNVIDVEISVGDSYEINNVIPDESIHMDDSDGILFYKLISKTDEGLTNFKIIGQEKGKVTIKVKDADGRKYRYKIKISK